MSDRIPTGAPASLKRTEKSAATTARKRASGAPPSAPTPAEIRALRESSGLTQPEFAALGHAHRVTCAQWESGVRGIGESTWDLIRARVALRGGDEAAALAVLRERL